MSQTPHTLGIIGDGQLGMMLCQAAVSLPIRTVMLCSDAQGAGAKAADTRIVGAMDSLPALQALIAECDTVTYEREDLPEAAIAALRAAEAAGDVRCFPPLDAIEIIQDKAKQKRWLADNSLATLPFIIAQDSVADAARAARELGLPLVQKALRGGFDGRGVQLLRSEADLSDVWPGETLFEQFAGDFREIAILVVRELSGSKQHFGPVDMRFETDYSVLDTVTVPANVDAHTTAAAVDLAYRAIDALDGVGVFGVEMFLLASGDVLINEISPRVHNAGHYTIEACASSQFEQHLRAVTGMPLTPTTLKTPACMKNLLCTPALKHEDHQRPAGVVTDDGVSEHWYGKSPARLMRKLGHITAVAETPEIASTRALARWQAIQQEAAAQ